MKVYWEADGKKRGVPGRAQHIGLNFEYGGKQRCIPVLYRFPEGIVFDLLTVLDEAELRAFHEKYQGVEETLSPVQQRAVEDEHPFQSVPINSIVFNGKQPLGGWSSTCSYHIPWMEDHAKLTKEAGAYVSQLNGASCFACERYTFPLYSDRISILGRLWRWLFPEQISGIEIEAGKTARFLPVELSFTLPRDFTEVHTETFRHPQTQTLYTMYFQSVNHEEVKIPDDMGTRALYIAQISYEIDPALPEGDSLQFCNSIQWEPVEADGVTAQSASSIGIIGGSDGPTSILVGPNSPEMPRGIHGLPLHSCFAKPSAKAEPTVSVILEGINAKWLDAETFLWGSKVF